MIEANRISGIKAYGDYQGSGGSNDRIQTLMAQSMEASRKLNEIMQRATNVNEAKK
jgi:hypothetical protein